MREFLKGSEAIEFQGQNRVEIYGWVERVLVSQEYASQGKKERGVLRAYIVKMTGLSIPQATRLIRKYRAEGVVEAVQYRRRRFPVKYTSQDVARLVEVDRAHGWLNGAATVDWSILTSSIAAGHAGAIGLAVALAVLLVVFAGGAVVTWRGSSAAFRRRAAG